MSSDLTKSPFGTVVETSAAALNLYKYGRKPYIFFAVSIALTSLTLQVIQQFKFVRGVNPPNPEWKESITQLQNRIVYLFRNLIYAGSFVLGVSQAVKKQEDIFNPDLSPVLLYGKLLVVLLLVEFVCNILLSPKQGKGGEADANAHTMPFVFAFLSWLRNLVRNTSEQMISGASVGFGYGYLIRGVGVLFKKYSIEE
jgi:hypothetical protein